jgi:hypothetical protein
MTPTSESTQIPDNRNHPLVALWHELLALGAAYDGSGEADAYPGCNGLIWSRLCEVSAAIDAARPDDLIGLAVQCRYLQRSLDIGWNEGQIEMAGSIATALAKLGGVDLPADPGIRSGDAS